MNSIALGRQLLHANRSIVESFLQCVTLAAATEETVLQKTVLTDPFNGQPMRFVLDADKPTVYSVGKDLKDDGGRVDWKFGTQPGDYLFILTPRAGTSLTAPPVVPPEPALKK